MVSPCGLASYLLTGKYRLPTIHLFGSSGYGSMYVVSFFICKKNNRSLTFERFWGLATHTVRGNGRHGLVHTGVRDSTVSLL